MLQSRVILILTICLTVCVDAKDVPPEFLQVTKRTTVIEALRPNPEFDRHDPSNIIRHQGRYWVFYTQNVDNHRDVSIHMASSADGLIWTNLGAALRHGSRGAWDESGTIAPYVVPHDGKFYLFYTGFCNSDLSTRQLGCAVADNPLGPWHRWSGNPVLLQNSELRDMDAPKKIYIAAEILVFDFELFISG